MNDLSGLILHMPSTEKTWGFTAEFFTNSRRIW